MLSKNVCGIILLMIFNMKKYSNGQPISIHPQSHLAKPTSACNERENAILIEQFFNHIFSEFYQATPACVCVQVCLNQPTYCYPNGCFKQIEIRRRYDEIITPSKSNNADDIFVGNQFSFSFLLDEPDDTKLIDEDVDELFESQGFVAKPTVLPENFKPQWFKDLDKSLFKYKKMPKLEMRYNLREKVKNMKSDKLRMNQNVDALESSLSKMKLLLKSKNGNTQLQIRSKNEEKFNKNIGKVYEKTKVANDTESAHYFKRDTIKNLIEENENVTKIKNFYLIDPKFDEKKGNVSLIERVLDSLMNHEFYVLPSNISEKKNTTEKPRSSVKVIKNVFQSDGADKEKQEAYRYNTKSYTTTSSTSTQRTYFPKSNLSTKDVRQPRKGKRRNVENNSTAPTYPEIYRNLFNTKKSRQTLSNSQRLRLKLN